MKRLILVVAVIALLFFIPFGLWRDVRLFALDANTGRVVWSHSLPNDEERTSNPLVAEGKVMVRAGPDQKQTLFAFDAANGKGLWLHRPAAWASAKHLYGEPLGLAKGVAVYTDAGKEELVTLDLATGAERWRVSSNVDDTYGYQQSFILSNPDLDKVIVVLLDRAADDTDLKRLRAYSLTGELLWDKPTEVYTPAYYYSMFGDDQAIYVATDYVRKINARTGEVMFTTKISGEGGLGFDRQTLYAAWGQDLTAVDTATGETRWHYNEPEMQGLFQIPTIGNNLYVTYSVMAEKDETTNTYYPDSWLFALSQTGQELWRKTLSASNENLGSSAFGQTPALIPGGVAVLSEKALLAFNNSGSERWRFPLRARCQSAASSGELVYVTASGPRYRHWLAYLNPQWH